MNLKFSQRILLINFWVLLLAAILMVLLYETEILEPGTLFFGAEFVFLMQVIMESLGGGGHQTMAAAQLKHITPEAAHSRIQTAIDQYREAQKKSGLESESEQKKKDKQ